ncbi:hypothetical protein vseg_011418 [Gypsophila vaccaria]
MVNISHALILTLLTIIITLLSSSNNAHSLPYTPHPISPSPSPSPPPSKPVTPASPPPTKPPTKKPAYPPAKAPSPAPKRKIVAVEGMVYCKRNCTYAGVDTLLGASPLPGAKVVMRCKNTSILQRKTTKTNKDGYFFMYDLPMMVYDLPMMVANGAHKCKVYLAHKPKTNGPCTSPAILNGGASGAYLLSNYTGPPKHFPSFSLFTVGPFTYEPSNCHKH